MIESKDKIVEAVKQLQQLKAQVHVLRDTAAGSGTAASASGALAHLAAAEVHLETLMVQTGRQVPEVMSGTGGTRSRYEEMQQELAKLEFAFERTGGRSVELAEAIDELRSEAAALGSSRHEDPRQVTVDDILKREKP